jgi:hypothetical protein
MGKPLLMLSSITYAMKARELLSKRGISAYLERTPRVEGAGGCGYSLYIPHGIDAAEAFLQQSGIHVLGRTIWEDAQ